jgi:tetratricopeptide (TPR) repeat protein
LVFVSGFGDDPRRPLKSWEIYRSWMRTVAARGWIGLMGETDPADVPGSLAALAAFLASRGAELGVDASRLAVWACSANVRGALPFVQSAGAPAGLRAAALLYGVGEAAALRSDLPVLLVIAGRDAPELVAAERALAARAVREGAPWTVVAAPRLAHAFDAFDTGEASRAAIAQILAFLDAHLGRLAPPPVEAAARRAARSALEHLYAHEFDAAHEYLNEIVDGPARGDLDAWLALAWARRGQGNLVGELVALEQAVGLAPGDTDLRRRYGRAAGRLSSWLQIEEALAPIETSPALDAIDLGLLGLARLQLGKADAAIAPLERAVALGAEPGTGYNLACAHARSGAVEPAFAALEAAIAAGFGDARLLAEDPDLEPLRADPRFAALARRVSARAQPESPGAAPP